MNYLTKIATIVSLALAMSCTRTPASQQDYQNKPASIPHTNYGRFELRDSDSNGSVDVILSREGYPWRFVAPEYEKDWKEKGYTIILTPELRARLSKFRKEQQEITQTIDVLIEEALQAPN